MKFYINQDLCSKLSIVYENKGGFCEVDIASLLLCSNTYTSWDDHHRAILSGFVRAGTYRMKLENNGFGKFSVLNYPSLLNPD